MTNVYKGWHGVTALRKTALNSARNPITIPAIGQRIKGLGEVTQFVAFDAVGADAQGVGLDAKALKLMTQPVKHRVRTAEGGLPMATGQVHHLRCGGTTKIKCPDCRGTGQQTCDFCEGKKIVPVTWTPSDNPVLSRQPDLIRLKDGRVLLGRVATRVGTKYTIKTRQNGRGSSRGHSA